MKNFAVVSGILLVAIAAGLSWAIMRSADVDVVFPLQKAQSSEQIMYSSKSVSWSSFPVQQERNPLENQEPIRSAQTVSVRSETEGPSTVKDAVSSLPGSVLIEVPFAPQAPFAVWDPLHEEACEEMSLIMVERFLRGKALTRDQAEEEVQKLVAWETEHDYGYDVTMEELAAIAREHYGLRAEVVTDVSVDTIKRYLSRGQPVIIPAAGRQLGNPYFSGEGPWYHNLVIIGYDHKNFIANDPGTKRGEHYVYPQQHLVNVIHDWTGVKEEIASGGKAMLVVSL